MLRCSYLIEKHFSGANAAFNRAALLNRNAILPVILFVLPLFYGAFIFLEPQPPEREITIIAVQPNISPLADYSAKNLPNIFGKQLALTDKALKKEAPDLILWNEVAVPFAAFSRFRSIETRRAVVRAAATGMTRATDKFGRVTAEVPMWSEQILKVRVALSD